MGSFQIEQPMLSTSAFADAARAFSQDAAQTHADPAVDVAKGSPPAVLEGSDQTRRVRFTSAMTA